MIRKTSTLGSQKEPQGLRKSFFSEFLVRFFGGQEMSVLQHKATISWHAETSARKFGHPKRMPEETWRIFLWNGLHNGMLSQHAQRDARQTLMFISFWFSARGSSGSRPMRTRTFYFFWDFKIFWISLKYFKQILSYVISFFNYRRLLLNYLESI